MKLNIQDTFNRELPSDPDPSNTRRQVFEACYSFVTPRVPSAPNLVHTSTVLASELGLQVQDLKSQQFLDIMSGSRIWEGSKPYAMCYGGHQFGHWAGQLGDGRAINLFEVVHQDKRWALQLKGSGETPYSRTADGLAVLRSSIREHLCSEAMHHLGVPTTRSLSLCLSGDEVLRDVMYDGHPAYEKGAIVCRVAPSFIRFGNFQIFASRRDTTNLKKLTDYTIKYFYPEIQIDSKEKYIEFFNLVVDRTLDMIVHWQRVGFVHGVMNTDNMSILGLTIDYGPYGWLDNYDKDWTPNTTDAQNRRYRYGNQPVIGQWNLFQLANALFPLIEDAKPLEDALHRYVRDYDKAYLQMIRKKLGLLSEGDQDKHLVDTLENTLALTETDMTIFFRTLADVDKKDTPQGALSKVKRAFYHIENIEKTYAPQWEAWMDDYLKRLALESADDKDRQSSMNKANPKYVLRNYMAQMAIDAADKGEYELIDELYVLMQNPYDEQVEMEKWFAKRPDWARHKIGCSMLSCSS